MRITSLRDSPAPAADLSELPRALVPSPAQEALADLRAAIARARLGAVLGVALVEVWSSTDRGTPMLFVHEVGPGAGRESALFPSTPQGVAEAGRRLGLQEPADGDLTMTLRALLLSTGLLLAACAPMDPPPPPATDGGVCEAPQVAAAVPGAPCCYACSPTVNPVPGQRCVPSYCRCAAASADGGADGGGPQPCCCTQVSPSPWEP